MLIYKICTRELWEETQRTGVFPGMPIDLRDGYIHLSTEQQNAGTIRKYFHGQRDLMLLAVESEKLGDALRWESSSTGRRGSFPHLYSTLKLSDVVEATSFDAPE